MIHIMTVAPNIRESATPEADIQSGIRALLAGSLRPQHRAVDRARRFPISIIRKLLFLEEEGDVELVFIAIKLIKGLSMKGIIPYISITSVGPVWLIPYYSTRICRDF